MTQIKTANSTVRTSQAKYQQEKAKKYTKLSWQHNFVTLQAQLRVQELESILTIPEKGPNKGVITLDHLKRVQRAVEDYESWCKFQGVRDPLKGIIHN